MMNKEIHIDKELIEWLEEVFSTQYILDSTKWTAEQKVSCLQLKEEILNYLKYNCEKRSEERGTENVTPSFRIVRKEL